MIHQFLFVSQAGNWQVEEAVQTSKTDLRHKLITEHH